VRILGHLLLWGPSDVAVSHVARAIVSTEEQEAGDLAWLEVFYDKHLLLMYVCIFRRDTLLNMWNTVHIFKGLTSETKSLPFRQPFNLNANEMKKLLREAPLNHTSAKALVSLLLSKKIRSRKLILQAISRDGYHCMLTGKMHAPYWVDG
jgi:hypothetical protein